MEMTLLAASGLAIVYTLYFDRRTLLFYLSTCVFLTTRFEAIAYYLVMIAPLFLRREARKAVTVSIFGLGIVGLQELTRYFVFHALLPNTITAMTHPPYSHFGHWSLPGRMVASGEFLLVLWPLVLLDPLVAVYCRLSNRTSMGLVANRELMVVLGAPLLAAALFAFATGRNWGYYGRMEFFSIPFALLLFGCVFDKISAALDRRAVRALLIGFSLMTIAWSFYSSAFLLRFPIANAIRSIAHGRVDADGAGGITPANLRMTGLSVDRIRGLLGLRSVVFATPMWVDLGCAVTQFAWSIWRC